MKLIFAPISIVLGLIAGIAGKKIFEQVWGLIDEEEPPKPEHREFSWPKLVARAGRRGGDLPPRQRPRRPRQPHLVRQADRHLAGRGGARTGVDSPSPG